MKELTIGMFAIIALVLVPAQTTAQSVPVRGKVVDQNGNSINTASVDESNVVLSFDGIQ